MSLLAKIQQKSTAAESKCLFAVVAGARLAGKTTIAGTLAGKTLLLQASVLESGSDSAKALAAQKGGDLVVGDFASIDELTAIIKELRDDSAFDHVVIDGLSAICDLAMKTPKIAAALKSNVWEGYRILGDQVSETILSLKELTYASKSKKPKNIFLTVALKVKQEGNTVDVELETRGKMAVSAVTKLGEAVLTLALVPGENNTVRRQLITKSTDIWPGRIDGLLDKDNPGTLEPDLGSVLALLKTQRK